MGWPTGLCAAAIGAWMVAYKLTAFAGLAYSSDLFQFAQLATSWLDGRFLADNCYGDHLSIHTYFLVPFLAVFVIPIGPAGLLLALGLAISAGFVAIDLMLRRLGLTAPAALFGATVISLMPLSLHAYQDLQYGFHVELLMPALGLWLAYFTLNRNWRGTVLLALALIAVKEEAPVLTGVIGAAILFEDLLRGWLASRAQGTFGWHAINLPALAAIGVAVVALPILLAILHAHAPQGYSPGSFQRIRAVDGMEVDQGGKLFLYIVANLGLWLRSPEVERWLWIAAAGTFGLVVLRPHLLLVGVATTLIAWLVGGDLLWAPRLAPSLAFFQVAATLGFAAAWRLLVVGAGGYRPRRVAGVLLLAGMIGAGLFVQFRNVPTTAEVYRLQPRPGTTPANRQLADAFFAQYREAAAPGEGVIANPHLFRYAHYRDLFWQERLEGRPTPVWVLADFGSPIKGELHRPGYRVFAQSGPFAIFRLDPSAPGPARGGTSSP